MSLQDHAITPPQDHFVGELDSIEAAAAAQTGPETPRGPMGASLPPPTPLSPGAGEVEELKKKVARLKKLLTVANTHIDTFTGQLAARDEQIAELTAAGKPS